MPWISSEIVVAHIRDGHSVCHEAMQAFLDVGFIIRDDVLKHEWKMKSTKEKWRRGVGYDFLLLVHEHLFVFRKMEEGEKPRPFEDSVKWW